MWQQCRVHICIVQPMACLPYVRRNELWRRACPGMIAVYDLHVLAVSMSLECNKHMFLFNGIIAVHFLNT